MHTPGGRMHMRRQGMHVAQERRVCWLHVDAIDAAAAVMPTRAGQECACAGTVFLSQRLAHSPHCHRQNTPKDRQTAGHAAVSNTTHHVARHVSVRAICATQQQAADTHSCRRGPGRSASQAQRNTRLAAPVLPHQQHPAQLPCCAMLLHLTLLSCGTCSVLSTRAPSPVG